MDLSPLRSLPGRLLNRLSGHRHAAVGPARLWKMKRDFQIAFLREQGLEPTHRLLDMGCGTLRGGLPLIGYLDPGHYTGVDVRESVIAEAHQELERAGLAERRPDLRACTDLAQLRLPQPVDFVWAFSVVIHMPDPVADACFGLAARSLAPGGRFLANVNVGEATEGSWAGFPVVFRSEDFYRGLAERHGLTLRSLGEIGALGHQSGTRADEQWMLEMRRSP